MPHKTPHVFISARVDRRALGVVEIAYLVLLAGVWAERLGEMREILFGVFSDSYVGVTHIVIHESAACSGPKSQSCLRP